MLWSEVSACAALASIVAAAQLALRLRDPLGTDEAYLWYGVLRVTEGRLPHRDFKSYEPGRYFWCAAFAGLFGPGLGVLRFATHAFLALGLTGALMALRLLGLDWVEIFLSAVILAAWAQPAHKLYEPVLWMMGFAASVWLLLDPNPITALAAGSTVSVALFFGFNYFLYLGASQALLWLVSSVIQPLPWNLLAWFGWGLALGSAPFVAMLCVRGFASVFFERRVSTILARGSTNLPLPIPWPGRATPGQLLRFSRAEQRVLKWLFAALPALPVTTLLVMLFARSIPDSRAWIGVVAAATLGATGWHHALSRADEVHMTQAMTPLLLLSICGLARLPGFLFSLLGLTLATLVTTWPLGHLAERRAAPLRFAPMAVGGLRVWMPAAECRLIQCASDLCDRELRAGGSLFAVPFLIGLYPILGKIAPMYDTFSVFPASEKEQERMIASIKANDVRLSLVWNIALDGREALRFSSTHPRVWEHLEREMEPIQGLGLSPDIYAFRAHARAD